MRLLLDESVPRPLVRSFADHEVHTVQSVGWAGKENGELLRAAAGAGFDALVTVDKGFEFQQNIETLPLTVAIMKAGGNRLEDLEPMIPVALSAIAEAQPCTLVSVGA